MKNNNDKSLESWIWDAACSIRGAKDAPKFKDFMPIAEIVEELEALEAESRETDAALKSILVRIGV